MSTPKAVLPSGRIVPLSGVGTPGRPWSICEQGGMYTLRRPRRGDSSMFDTFMGGRITAQVFDRWDAEALESVLNSTLVDRRLCA